MLAEAAFIYNKRLTKHIESFIVIGMISILNTVTTISYFSFRQWNHLQNKYRSNVHHMSTLKYTFNSLLFITLQKVLQPYTGYSLTSFHFQMIFKVCEK